MYSQEIQLYIHVYIIPCTFASPSLESLGNFTDNLKVKGSIPRSMSIKCTPLCLLFCKYSPMALSQRAAEKQYNPTPHLSPHTPATERNHSPLTSLTHILASTPSPKFFHPECFLPCTLPFQVFHII